MKITLVGRGKMGNCVAECLNGEHEIVNWVARGKIKLNAADVLIDFSFPQMIEHIYDYCVGLNVPAVIATTGLNDSQFAVINEMSSHVAVLYSQNMSIGILAAVEAIKTIKKRVQECDVSIVEKHHKAKLDSPSGTAIMLNNALGGGINPLSIRAGNCVGEHEISFDMIDECISVKHTAYSRKIFALGAIKCAQILIKKAKGLYSLSDLIS